MLSSNKVVVQKWTCPKLQKYFYKTLKELRRADVIINVCSFYLAINTMLGSVNIYLVE